MQLLRRLKEFVKDLKIMTTIKRWVWVFSSGLAIGILLGGQSAYWSIIKDCKIMGMFRYGDAPLSCTYHLVNIPMQTPTPEPKEKKK
jgi:hypothetical protein